MKQHHFGATTQCTHARYPDHTQIMCNDCGATLIGKTLDHGFSDGNGRFSKDCPHCYTRTFYDGPLPMAEERKPPPQRAHAPFVQMPKPTPLPKLANPRPIWLDRKPLPMTYVVRALIVIWCLSAAWVYLK